MSPPYPPHLQTIHFPTAKAEAAKTVCDRIAGLLDDHLTARATLVSTVREEWSGAHRDEFDDAWSVQEHRLIGMKQSLQTLSGDLEDAIDGVADENSSRAAGRTQWLQDNPGPWPV